MALNINISEQNKQRLFNNNAGRKYTAASGISYIVQSNKSPKIDYSVSIEFKKDRFWEEIEKWTNPPQSNRNIFMIAEDKHCFLSIFPNYNRIFGDMNSKHHLEVFARGENKSFTETIEGLTINNPYAENRLLIAINSAYMYFFESSYKVYGKAVFNIIPYSQIGINGIVSHNGTSFNPNSVPSTDGFHILHSFDIDPPSHFYFGQGDVPLYLGEGVGALTPILMYNTTYNRVWRYGNKNEYTNGITQPETGDPGINGPYLRVRSNSQYKEQNLDSKAGRNIIAYCEEKDVLIQLAAEDGSAKNLDYYRDCLYNLGFEYAVGLDGGSSSHLYYYPKKKSYVQLLKPLKNNTVPIGFVFYV